MYLNMKLTFQNQIILPLGEFIIPQYVSWEFWDSLFFIVVKWIQLLTKEASSDLISTTVLEVFNNVLKLGWKY